MWKPAALLAVAAPLLLAQGTVEGVVLNSVSRTPVPGAKVELLVNGKAAYESVAGASGAFRINDIPPGDYTPSFDAEHYFAFQADPIRVTSAGETVHVQGELDPGTKLTGRVLDPDGKPLAGVLVTTFTLTTRQGIMSFATDKDGAFHPPDLQPGYYYLQARPNRGMSFPKGFKVTTPVITPSEKRILAPTYYPGVTDMSQATRILATGGELSGFDIHLRSVPVYRIRGKVFDENGKPAEKVTLSIRPAGFRFAESFSNPDGETVSGPGGVFEFADVSAGNWRIAAESKRDSGELRGFSEVTVTRHDEENIPIHLAAPFTLEGTVERDVSLKGVYLTPENAPSRYEAYADVDSEGAFHLRNVYPGRYRINPSRLTGAYLAAVRLGQQDVTGQALELSAGAPSVRLIFRSDMGTVRGTVKDGAHALVVLFPESGEFPTVVRCSADGKFEVSEVQPGNYLAAAYNRVERDLLGDGIFVQQLTRGAVSVRVEPSRPASLELALSVWPQ